MKSYIEIVEQVDNFPYRKDNSGYYTLCSHDGIAIGFITKYIFELFQQETGFIGDEEHKLLTIAGEYDTLEKRNKLFETIGHKWKQFDVFETDLKHGWRDELYTIYNPSRTPYLQVERAFSVLMGVATYGVHVNGFVSAGNSSDGKIKLWIPKRAANKPTYPNMFDNTIAGGLGYPYGIWETVVKESFEEAGISQSFVEEKCKSRGVLLYMHHVTSGIERVQPEVQYIFDLEFPDESVIPEGQDGESVDFKLMDLEEVLEKLRLRQFKPNCGLVIVDFLIRHGYITAENEERYLDVVTRSHRDIPFPKR